MVPSCTSLSLALRLLTYLAIPAQAAYTLQDDYSPANFFNMFDFFTGPDPTHGYVNYLDETDAQLFGLTNINNNQVYMGVDYNTIAQTPGRSSVRIASKNIYNHGLIILDLEHMPGGVCGTWPAFWLLGPDWPNNGEVDIIENVNSASTNQMTLHTDATCSITENGLSSGSIVGTNCDVDATGNAGCSITTTNTETYGNAFNAANGGVYATEWTSNAFTIWFFPRGSIPSDITAGTPEPANWGLALAEFSGGCDIDGHFLNQQIVFDTTFCGDWASAVWSTDPVCSTKASTCIDYVMNNPSDFTDAYWSINSLKVYQDNGGAASSPAGDSSTTFVSTIAATTTNPLSSATPTFTTSFSSRPSGSATLPLSNTFFTSSSKHTPSSTLTLSSTFTNTFFTLPTSNSAGFMNTIEPQSWTNRVGWTSATGT